MNLPPAAQPQDESIDADGDAALKRALAGLPLGHDPDRMEALNQRVLTQWAAGQAAREAQPSVGSGGQGARAWLMHGGGRRSWVTGATGLALGVALVMGAWWQASDPALDDLLQPDVLSQMAAGEM